MTTISDTTTPTMATEELRQLTERHVRRTTLVERLASWRVWLVSGALFVPFAVMFFASSANFAVPEVEAICGQAPPDVRPYTSGSDIVSFLDECGPAGREAYRNMQIADLAYPAVVGVFLAASLALATRRLGIRKSLQWLPLLPLVASGLDYLENACAWLAMRSYPETILTNDLLGLASAAKTSLSWTGGLALLVCLATLAVQGARRHATRWTDRPSTNSRRSTPRTRLERVS